MSQNTTSEDTRSIKTEKALYAAMFSLLKKQSFRKITIKAICEEALISRAAFYTHFIDKYDLLKCWITELWPKEFNGNNIYEQIENAVNNHIDENNLVLRNLFFDADNETFVILFDFILSTTNLTAEGNHTGELCPEDVVLANFYAGGIISYLLWQIKNKFPSDVQLMNRHFFEMIRTLQDRHANNDKVGGDV